MKDAELIYALYVQANPVPNPDLLPLTQDDSVLLTIERSQDMITHEPIEGRPAPRATRRNILVATGAFAAVVVGLVTVLLVNNNDPAPIAAAEAAPAVTFDGTTCSYEGPILIEEGIVEVSVINSADVVFTLAGWLMDGEALEAELQRTPIGTDMATPPGTPLPDGQSTMASAVLVGQSRTSAWLLTPGIHLLDCKTVDHVWRSARIEVVAP